jgi:hypothetical protein
MTDFSKKDYALRDKAIKILNECKHHDRASIFKAIFDLDHNAKLGDEKYLYPLLEHTDDGIVSNALYALYEVFEQKVELDSLVRKMAWGDERDCDEMPIQTMAIRRLCEIARKDSTALEQLKLIAEDDTVYDCPRQQAWHCLAELFNVEWYPKFTEEMIMSPQSNNSELIRESIRKKY